MYHRPPLAVWTLTLTEDEWIPLSPPFDANSIGIRNITDKLVDTRVVENDPDTYDDLGPGAQKGFTGPVLPGAQAEYRFKADTPVIYLKSSEGSGTTQVRVTILC